MMRALFSGVTGLRSHQTRMDVIGNNIANVNTSGYKKASVTFADLYSETLSAAAAASGTGTSATGGVNAKQIGLGSTVASIAKIHTPGSAQYTGNSMDVAISGDGYFAVQTPTGIQYTRAGNFKTDTLGNLVTSSGYYVQCVTPNQTAEQTFIFESVDVEDLVVANTKIEAPAGTIHTGTPTADLQKAIGHEYSFGYAPSTEHGGYKSSTSIQYVASMPIPDTLVKDDVAACTGKLDMGTIANAFLNRLSATEQPTKGPSDYKVTFGANGSKLTMIVDGKAVSSDVSISVHGGGTPVANGAIAVTAPTAASPLGTSSINLDFSDVMDSSVNLGNISLTFEGDLTQGTAGARTNDEIALLIANKLNSSSAGLTNVPSISLEENGTWKLYDLNVPGAAGTLGAVVDENVILTTTNQGLGTAINAGDFTLATQEYGTFRLNLSSGVKSAQELSDELKLSKFSLNITEDHVVEYTSPGQVDSAMLKNLTVDFDKFTGLTIDTKGAVIAQLLVDDVVTVGGTQVPRKAGDKVVLGYISLATFNNPSGLESTGDNMFVVSANSGNATYTTPSNGNAGSLSPSNLEMSNVDLSEEMVNMIITQRGFQANSRIITTTDTMLEELVNLKR